MSSPLGDVQAKPSSETKERTSSPYEEREPRENGLELGIRSTYVGGPAAAHLSQSHRDYLLKRHGTLDLNPIPSEDPADPYNWPVWKKNMNLVVVAFHACMTTFFAAGIIPAFEDIAEDLHISLQQASYLTSAQIIVLGFGPLFWKPISNRYGRRPVWMISTILSGVCNIGCAVSHSYGAMVACRCLVSFFISPAIAIGSGVVVETFFTRERGQKLGIWTLMVTLGPPAGPFFMGFVAYHVGYRWIYWTFAIINAVQFVAVIFLCPETRYIRQGVEHHGSAFRQEYLTFRRIDPAPLSLKEFINPVFLGKYASILVPTISYSIVFCFSGVLLTVEIPQLFIPKFHLNPQALGLNFLGMIVGSVIGEQLGGTCSDWWMARRSKQLGEGRRPAPEYRLWLSYPGFVLAMVGLIVFGVRTEQATTDHWNITPIIGIGISAAGSQVITTVLVTYAVDCHHELSASIGVFVNLIRSTWAFIGPFWFPACFGAIGVSGTTGLLAGLIGVASIVPILLLQILRGKRHPK